MLQILGLIVLVYAGARLVQVPIEAGTSPQRWILLALVSGMALLVLAGRALALLLGTVPTGPLS